ncbi:MAG TPA: hypothetical protein VKT28_02020 [Puia sp.]|nr:hypothetical protein [Puia sp.]
MAYSPQAENQTKTPEKHHPDLPTIKTIKAQKEIFCQSIKTKLGNLNSSSENCKGLTINYEHRKCRFVKTEKNYRIYRNLELSVGIELVKALDSLNNNITTYVGYNTSLVTALGAVVQAAKTAKSKFSDLRDSASKLEACTKDSCNRTQMTILTGERHDDCKDKKDTPAHPQHRPDDCKCAGEIIHELIKKPAHLCMGIDSVLSSAVDIVGIQTFSNISSLSQTFFPAIKKNATDLDGFINSKITAGATELTAAQTALSDSIKALTDGGYQLYNSRIDIDVDNGVKEFLCHLPCDCICDEDDFKKCKCKICEICEIIPEIFKKETSEKQPA